MNCDVPRVGLLATLCVLTALGAWAETSNPARALPTPFPELRYHQMSAKSPFAVASAAASTAAPTPGFASQLDADAVAEVGQSYYVAIKSRDPDKPTAMFLKVGETSEDGIKVDAVHWSDEMGKSTVDVSKNGEKATLNFDEAQMAQAPGPAVASMPGQPGIRLPALPGQGRPLGFPVPGQGAFNRNRIFPQPQQGAPGTPGMAPGVEVRRRLRVIPSGQ